MLTVLAVVAALLAGPAWLALAARLGRDAGDSDPAPDAAREDQRLAA